MGGFMDAGSFPQLPGCLQSIPTGGLEAHRCLFGPNDSETPTSVPPDLLTSQGAVGNNSTAPTRLPRKTALGDRTIDRQEDT